MSFEIADITSYEVQAGSYDVIYSRDTILHIHDKPALFRRCATAVQFSVRSLTAAAFASKQRRRRGQTLLRFAQRLAS